MGARGQVSYDAAACAMFMDHGSPFMAELGELGVWADAQGGGFEGAAADESLHAGKPTPASPPTLHVGKVSRTRVLTLTDPPSSAPGEPSTVATWIPSTYHGLVWHGRYCVACPACTTPISGGFTRLGD